MEFGGENAAQADIILEYLFDQQNHPERKLAVVILSGDIHTSGYASIFSSEEKHGQRSSIPHITSSSISYVPFNWILEAIYRHASKIVPLGKRGKYIAQVSHHFCARSLAVLSVRPRGDGENQLKVKYYLEGYPEPQILLFDLDRTSHRENINWVAAEKLFPQQYAQLTAAGVNMEAFLRETDVAALLERRAARATQKLNYRESIVDLLKLLDQDSSAGARKRLAKQLGYDKVEGGVYGSPQMNIWLHQQVMQRFIEGRGQLPGDFNAPSGSTAAPPAAGE